MDELLEQFLIEAPELIEQAATDVVALERNSADTVAIDSAFRAIHTLKGSVALFDFGPMGNMLHAAEGLLEDLRRRRAVANTDVITALLGCINACETWVTAITQTQRLPESAEREAAHLTSMIEQAREWREAPAKRLGEGWLDILLKREQVTMKGVTSRVVAARYSPAPECFFRGEDPIAYVRSVPQLLALQIDERQSGTDKDFDPYSCSLSFQLLSAAPIEDVRLAFAPCVDVEIREVEGNEQIASAQSTPSAAPSRTVRIEAGRVDRLANMVGELVVANNEYAHLIARASQQDIQLARALSTNQASINRLASEMHRAVMSLRMVPLSRTLRRLPRVVRDIADRLGKSASFSIQGDELEADKEVVDGVYDPLLHLLRNALDHGLEPREQRAGAGKAAEGRISVVASRAGDDIVISVSDDGAGIDAAKIRKRAEQIGLKSVSELQAMTEAEAFDLIFTPGFTTASNLTEVSGRGVGMDAVRKATEALGGRTTIESSHGQGTTVRLIVPQAVVVTTVLVIGVAGERFGVPIDAVAETVRISMKRVTRIRSGAAFVLRDRTIPLVALSSLLGLPGNPNAGEQRSVLIVRTGSEFVGLEFDDVEERIDVLVRPMIGLLAAVPGALGTALMGDGSVLMVLNVQELVDDNSGKGWRDPPNGLVRAR